MPPLGGRGGRPLPPPRRRRATKRRPVGGVTAAARPDGGRPEPDIDRFKRTSPVYRQAIQAAYESRPLDERRRQLAQAHANPHTPESRATIQAHRRRTEEIRRLVLSHPGATEQLTRSLPVSQRLDYVQRTPSVQRQLRSDVFEHRRQHLVKQVAEARRHQPDTGGRMTELDSLAADLEMASPHYQKILDEAERAATRRKKPGLSAAGIGGAVDNLLSGKTLAGGVADVGDFLARQARKSVPAHLRAFGSDIPAAAAREAIDLPAGVVPSVYMLGKEVVTGHPKKAAQMFAEPFIETARHPLRSFEEHPLSTALIVTGAGRGAIRGARRAQRAVAGKPPRPVREVPGTALRDIGPVPKGLRRKKSGVMSERGITRRVDETVAAHEIIRRHERGQVVAEAEQALYGETPPRLRKARRKPSAAASLIAQNIVKPTRDDLEGYLAELRDAHGRIVGHEKGESVAKRKANEAAQKEIQKALEDLDLGRDAAAAKRIADLSVRQERALVDAGLLAPEQAEMARLIPYAVRRMGAKHDAEGLHVELPGGRVPLTAEEIRAHMAEHGAGLSEPAFLSHKPGQRQAASYYVPTHRAPLIAGQPRTGAAVREGTFEMGADALIDQAARNQGLVSAARLWPKFVGEYAVRGTDGAVQSFSGYRGAHNAMLELNARGDVPPMRPVPASAFGASKAQREEFLRRAEAAGDETGGEAHVFEQIADALRAASINPDRSGKWVLLPEAAVRRLEEHVKTVSPSGGERAFRQFGQMFRRTILTLSPKWFHDNIFEAAVRAAVAHAGPLSYATGRRALGELERVDPDAALELRARVAPGGLGGTQRTINVRSQAEHYAGSSAALRGLVTALGKLRRAPGAKQVADAWGAYSDFVFQLSGAIESQFQIAMFGRALRDSPLLDGHTLKLGKQAMAQAARGLRDTNEMVSFGRQVDDMFGRYSKLSPAEKRTIAQYTPFARWALNSVRFLYVVLPRDHPVLVAALAAANQAAEEWRHIEGLDDLVAWQRGFLPGPDGKVRRPPGTPFDIAGDPLGIFAGQVLPQFNSVIAAAEGRTWLGYPISGDPEDPVNRALHATWEAVKTTIPGVGAVSRAVQGKPPVSAPYRTYAARRRKATKTSKKKADDFWGTSTDAAHDDDDDFWGTRRRTRRRGADPFWGK